MLDAGPVITVCCCPTLPFQMGAVFFFFFFFPVLVLCPCQGEPNGQRCLEHEELGTDQTERTAHYPEFLDWS